MLKSWTREDLLFLPPAFTVLSLLYVSVKRLKASWGTSNDVFNGKVTSTPVESEEHVAVPVKHHIFAVSIERLDGLVITLFRTLRLLTILGLLALEVLKLSTGQGSSVRFYQPFFYIYASALAISSIIASPRWRDVTSRQLALLFFSEFLVYFVLDVWPYATLKQSPLDSVSDPATWVRIALLTFGGAVIPLVMPRPFRALTPGAQPSLEDTSSLFSRYTYSFLDRIVFYAYSVPDVTVADMPEVPERHKIEVLSERALEILDPVKNGKKHLVWGVLRIWGKDYALLLLCLALNAVADFVGPYGMKNLLQYLETGVLPHDLHAWVWIVVLTVGPLAAACLDVQFLYVSTRIIIENTSVLTYLVFHHALRIRLKSDSLDDKNGEKQKKDKKSVDSSSAHTSNTPATSDVETIAGSDDGHVPTSSDADAATSATAVSDTEPTVEGGHAKEKTGHLVGKINNLITTDLQSIISGYYVLTFPVAVLQVAIAAVFLYNLLGWSGLVGIASMFLFLPGPIFIGRLIAKVQKKKMDATDKRVQAVTESVGVLRMIKLFAWEPYMLKQLARRREEELSNMKRGALLESGMSFTNQFLPILAKLIAFSLYTVVAEGEFKASRIFSAIMVFRIMEVHMFQLMYTIPELLRAKVSYDRYSDFLNTTELLSESSTLSSRNEEADTAVVTEQPHKDIIGLNACSFSWEPFGSVEARYVLNNKHTRKQFELRFDTEVIFKHNHINLIVGPTASGKTSVLMALLGEMYCKPHILDSWYSLPRDKGIAYAPQESWVLNETIRENILFGEPFDEERYKKVLDHCALQRDLDLWEAGDLTEVGEKGLTLSGGQKARVTLARTLYSSASIILLDDVLAALDVHTAKWVVNKAFKGDLVQGRTILLVTHNIALAAPVAEHVVVLGRNGSVTAQGPVSEVLQKNTQLRTQMEKERKETDEVVEDKLDEEQVQRKSDTEGAKKAAGKLIIAEEKAMGRVELAAIMLYVGGIGGPLIWMLVLGIRWFGMLVMIFQSWFVGYWANQSVDHLPADMPVLGYLGLYVFANLSGSFLDFLSQVIWAFRVVRASRIIHFRLLESIFTSPFRWLDITPVGRIITRCTQDTSLIDESLGRLVGAFMAITMNLICLFSAAVLMVGWYALIPGVIITILGGTLGRIYLKCQICVRREMSNSKSPVVSQVGTALSGLPSIRAYGAQKFFDSELRKRIDLSSRTSFTFYDINRWISIRIDGLGAIFTGLVSAYLVYWGRTGPGFAGFTLSMILSFTRLILLWVRIYNLCEIQANSLERMLEFMRIEHEPKPTEGGKPPAYWPSSGELRVEKLCARYSDDSPEVLRDISFEVKSGERVGIVGRTGAGKSSVALALLRAIKTTGKVYYDGLATDEMNLDALRSSITLIPQQPELIHGTLRENLDPFEQHDDALLNDALRSAGFFNTKELGVKQDAGKHVEQREAENGSEATGAEENVGDAQASELAKIGLDTMVESGGANFSLGQRQIIALARAIVRRSKLLILDEATAAIDYDTDSAIQKTLRTEFSRDTTLITIAHRLQTIIDYDKIMVLDAGQVVEFGSPKELLRKGKGFLRGLVDESDDREILLHLADIQ